MLQSNSGTGYFMIMSREYCTQVAVQCRLGNQWERSHMQQEMPKTFSSVTTAPWSVQACIEAYHNADLANLVREIVNLAAWVRYKGAVCVLKHTVFWNAYFHLDVVLNRQNIIIWANEHPHNFHDSYSNGDRIRWLSY